MNIWHWQVGLMFACVGNGLADMRWCGNWAHLIDSHVITFIFLILFTELTAYWSCLLPTIYLIIPLMLSMSNSTNNVTHIFKETTICQNTHKSNHDNNNKTLKTLEAETLSEKYRFKSNMWTIANIKHPNLVSLQFCSVAICVRLCLSLQN